MLKAKTTKMMDKPQRPVPSGVVRVQGATIRTGAAGMRDATVRMKKITGGRSVFSGLGEEGEKVRIATLQKLEASDHTHPGQDDRRATTPLLLERQAIAEVVGGASPSQVEVEYGLAKGYVRHAMTRRYGSPEAAMTVLQGLVLEVGIACNVHALTQIENMSGPQAVMSGAIAIDKALSLTKAIAERPKTIDFGRLAEMGKTLTVLREIATKPRPAVE